MNQNSHELHSLPQKLNCRRNFFGPEKIKQYCSFDFIRFLFKEKRVSKELTFFI